MAQAQPVQHVTCREYLAWRLGVGVPYLDTLADLAQINAGHPLPKSPRSVVEAAVRRVAERARLRAWTRLDAPPAALVDPWGRAVRRGS